MIKENQRFLNRVNILSDVALLFISAVISYFIRFYVFEPEQEWNIMLLDYLKLCIILVPVQIIIYNFFALYGSFRSKPFVKECFALLQANVVVGILMMSALFVLKYNDFSRWTLFFFLVINFLLTIMKRFILRKTLRAIRSRGYNIKNVLLVGGGSAASDYLRKINENKSFGFRCGGYIADEDTLGGADDLCNATAMSGGSAINKAAPSNSAFENSVQSDGKTAHDFEAALETDLSNGDERVSAKYLGGYDRLTAALEATNYDEVVCALDFDEAAHLVEVVEACEQTGSKISIIPICYKYMSSNPAIDQIENIPLLNIRRIPLDDTGNAIVKRAMDIVGSLFLIILTSPVMLFAAIGIKLTSRGPIIFKQERVGLNKESFTMLKFRSMKLNDESETAWSKDEDARKTKFGAFLRKVSIDELPQLFNVLKGDMSLVGPRPEIPFFVESFKNEIPMYMIKHQVKPGITGYAQVSGWRGDTSIKKRIECDIYYIENWDIIFDINILFRTLFGAFRNSEKIAAKNKGKKDKNKGKQEKTADDKDRQKTEV